MIFSAIGRRIAPRSASLMSRLYNIIVNNYLSPDINGERWLISQLPSPRVLLDVGFHRGHWTRECAQRFPEAQIYCFDPWPPARGFFERNELSDNVQFFDLALSNTEGRSRFYDYGSGCNSLSRRDVEPWPLLASYDVAVTTLDSWCALHRIDHIDFLNIDTEGYDLAILEGARQLMDDRAIYAFCFEYASGWIASRRFLGEADRYVRDHGYSLFKLFPNFLAPFVYRTDHETFHGAMFVGLSPAALASGHFRTRQVRCL
jgi:FkbM family methyltransferase